MTWMSTWCANGLPEYAVHSTEQAAKNHADSKKLSGMQAVHFWHHDIEGESA